MIWGPKAWERSAEVRRGKPFSIEHRKRLSESLKGRPYVCKNPEAKSLKLRLANLGKKHSVASRKKMSESAKRRGPHLPLTPLSQRLSTLTVRGPNGCRLWIGVRQKTGYGTITVNGKLKRVHRVAWEVANNTPIPIGMCVCHKCDVKLCINPRHLFLGTHADNVRDMVRKNRQKGGRRRT